MQGREHLAAVANPQGEGVRALEEALELIPGPGGEEDRLGQAPAGTEHVAELKKRTLTTLYNARPAWLDNAHRALDAAVAAAYGWVDYRPDMSDEEILRRLLALNLARSGGGGPKSRRSG